MLLGIDWSNCGCIRIIPMIAQAVAAPSDGSQRRAPVRTFKIANSATNSTSPRPPKKLSIVSEFCGWLRCAQ